ncbi:MAG: GNAT family N-acetyltransferase [Candidatus Sericytochromatia bacterium]
MALTPEWITEIEELLITSLPPDYILPHLSENSLVSLLREGTELVGAAILNRKKWHPVYPQIVLAIAEMHRRRGLGTQLHQRLLAEHPLQAGERGYDAACYQTQRDAIGFLKRLGYRHVLDCHLLEFSTSFAIALPTRLKLMSLSEFASGQGSLQAIKDFLISHYHALHDWNPPLERHDPCWNGLALQDADLELSVVALEDGQIRACSTGCPNGACLDIIWSYAQTDGLVAETALLKSLIAFQCGLASERRLTSASMEIDSNDLALSAFRQGLAISAEQVWSRFRLDRPASDFM